MSAALDLISFGNKSIPEMPRHGHVPQPIPEVWALDDHLWQQLYKWARRRHPKKPRRWVTTRYFGQYHPTRNDRWVFGDRYSGAYLHRYAWTKIVRHVPVTGRNSPDDPALAQYWADRRRKRKPPQLTEPWERALRTQHGICPLCREPLLYVDNPPDS